jgi:hypothetical protein
MYGGHLRRLRSPLRSHRRKYRDRDGTLTSIGDSPFPSRRPALCARREVVKQHFEEDYYKSLSVCCLQKQDGIPTEAYTLSNTTKQSKLPPPSLYFISSPDACLSANKAGRLTDTPDIPCNPPSKVTLQSEARKATPAHRQPSLSLKRITIYYISCLSQLPPCPPETLALQGTNHAAPVSSVSDVAQALEGTIRSLVALAGILRTAVRE